MAKSKKTTNELIEVVPLATAQKAYDQAKRRQEEAFNRLAGLRAVKGEQAQGPEHFVKVMSAEVDELRHREEIFEAGVALDSALRNEAMASDDPRIRAASPQSAIVDCEALAAEATRLRASVADRISEVFSTGGDIREHLAELSTLEAAAEQAEKLIQSRLRYGFEQRTKLASERRAAGLPKPPPFPGAGAHESDTAYWMREVRQAIHAGPETERKGYRERIARLANERDKIAAELEAKRIDKEETARRHELQAKSDKEADERRARERAAEIAAQMAEADRRNSEAAKLAASYLKRNG